MAKAPFFILMNNMGHQNNYQVHSEFLKYGENSKSEQKSVTTQHSCFKNGSCASIFTVPWRQIVAFPPRQFFLFLYSVVNNCPQTLDCSKEIMSPQEKKGSLSHSILHLLYQRGEANHHVSAATKEEQNWHFVRSKVLLA